MDSQGRVVFSEVVSNAVWRIGADGELEKLVAGRHGALEKIAEGFAARQGQARAPDGSLWAVDGARLRRIAPDGRVATVGGDPLGGVSHGEPPRLRGVALRPDGSALVADYDHHCIREVKPDGRVSVLFRSGLLWSPSGVATAGGAVYLLESRPESVSAPLEALGSAVRVRRIAPDGSVETLAVVEGSRVARAVVVVVAAAVVVLVVFAVRREGTLD